MSPEEALERLREGNRRFVAGEAGRNLEQEHLRRAQLVLEQEPFAIVLGCSDSRVPAELVFDQGIGDLFVIRVAGNIAAPSQLGSIEFAVKQYDTPLANAATCGKVAFFFYNTGRIATSVTLDNIRLENE